jgi:hypothetical protein
VSGALHDLPELHAATGAVHVVPGEFLGAGAPASVDVRELVSGHARLRNMPVTTPSTRASWTGQRTMRASRLDEGDDDLAGLSGLLLADGDVITGLVVGAAAARAPSTPESLTFRTKSVSSANRTGMDVMSSPVSLTSGHSLGS